MTPTLSDLQQQRQVIEVDLERARALARLRQNPDFKRLFEQGFLSEDCLSFFRASFNHGMDAAARENARDFAAAGARLAQFLDNVERRGENAIDTMRQLQRMMDSSGQDEGEE